MAVTYKCPKCGSSMEYNGELGKMACDHCGNTMTVEELEQANGVQEEFIKDHEERITVQTAAPSFSPMNIHRRLSAVSAGVQVFWRTG